MRLRDLAAGHLQAQELDAASTAIDAVLDDDAAWRFAPCVTHGDLGPEHVLVSASGDLSGVLDWEEVGIGDPAWDFAWWVHEMPAVGERALAAYGGAPDPGFATRARLSFVLMPLHDLDHGLQVERPRTRGRGARGLPCTTGGADPTGPTGVLTCAFAGGRRRRDDGGPGRDRGGTDG